jgi:hypothetical protein
MFCPKCRVEYREGFSTCADCGAELIPELPPEPEQSVEYVDLIKLRTFSSRHEAELARGFLIANGIHAAVFGDDYGGIQPGLSFSTGVKLMVSPEDAQTAETLLNDTDDDR